MAWLDQDPKHVLLLLYRLELGYKVGNLISAMKSNEIDVVAHCCNCFNTMGSGIAPLIASQVPEAREVDKETIKGDISKLGTFSCAWDAPTKVFNLYGQYNYGNDGKKYLSDDALDDAIKLMSEYLNKKDPERKLTIGLPMIGAGRAGGDWHKIEEFIQWWLCSQGWKVTIYVLTEEDVPAWGVLYEE